MKYHQNSSCDEHLIAHSVIQLFMRKLLILLLFPINFGLDKKDIIICNTPRDPTEYWTDQFLLNLLDTHAISQPTSSTAISNIYCLSRSRIAYVHLDCSFGPII